ncbi:MAG: hypothetical protein N4J56_004409 [Chroococcidiopsis sp. SAG 2025]|uniref:hypothetical protein n=1 Tax=Chroococcidiopsis sp. SAG 2025 TaxID=171389 RepID=UPI0029371ABA|nr:hypothetical protein [Chroococcidiopsis sp. SAG 2025]MDV2994755.1 hypothetical protein [Chroococcidiopsis sp. SAG 2025]
MKTKYLLTLSLLASVLGNFETAIAQVTSNENTTKILPDFLKSELMHSAAPASAKTSDNSLTPKTEFSVFPVGINIGDRNVKSGALVRGREDGKQVLNFANWQLSYDDVIQVLKFNVTTLVDGQIEVRSAGIVTRLNPKKLRTDPELGLVFSIQDLQTLFGVKAKFDLNEYAIVLEVPWLAHPATNTFEETETPVVLNGLQRLYPGRLNIAGRNKGSTLRERETPHPLIRETRLLLVVLLVVLGSSVPPNPNCKISQLGDLPKPSFCAKLILPTIL